MPFRAISRKDAIDFGDPLHKRHEFLRDFIFNDCPHVGKNGENISTNHELCEEILSKIGDLNNKEVLVWFNPEFFFTVKKNWPNANIVFITGSTKAKDANFGNHVRLIQVDPYGNLDTNVAKIKSEVKNMKFDVVIGNPPYQKSTDESSFTNLWAEFVLKSFELSKRYVAIITPKTWGNQVTKENSSSQVFNLIKKYGILVNIDECRRHFPMVGSSFSYYILDKEKKNPKCIVITEKDTLNISWDEVFFVPNNFNLLTINIVSKLLSNELFEYISSANTVGNISDTKDDIHKYSVRYSMGTEKWSDTPHRYQFIPKLIFPNQTTKNYPIYAPASAPANRGVFYVVQDEKMANQMLSYFKSKIIQFLISEQRTHHGVLNTQVIQRIPKVDITRVWTDKELYDHFGLTKEERLHIDPEYKD